MVEVLASSSVADGHEPGEPSLVGAPAGCAIHRFVVEYLIGFGGRMIGHDYDALVIWGVLALHDAGSANARRAVRALPSKVLRQRDIARLTGIPRETVRRKLLRLQADGWIERAPPGWTVQRASSSLALDEVSREWTRRFIATADDIAHLLERERPSTAS